ncbi:hypothetical protein UMZ34_25725 [Halopseudomonas pachastrellae]|nr:hypothetical protein UMZ34_25725 [Halopseudomonas pachastrellae]
MQQAQTLWTVGRSQPNACDPLFDRWRAAGGLNDDVVWQRIRLALLYRQDALARYLTKLMQNNQALDHPVCRHRHPPTKLRDASAYRSLPPCAWPISRPCRCAAWAATTPAPR